MMQANSETVQDRETTVYPADTKYFLTSMFRFLRKVLTFFCLLDPYFECGSASLKFLAHNCQKGSFFFLPTLFNSHIVQCQGGERRERDQRVPGGIPGLHHVGCWPCWAGQVPISSTGKNSCNLDRKKCAIRVLDNQAGQVPGTEEKMRQLLQHSGIR